MAAEEENKIKAREREIGQKAAKMAETFLHSVIKQKLEIRNKGDKKNLPILDATRVTAKMGTHRLLGLNLTSSKVGFILNSGFTGVREAGPVFFKASRYHIDQTLRKPHQASLKEQNFLENIYSKSGALDYIIPALGETRTDVFVAKLSDLLLKLNTTDE